MTVAERQTKHTATSGGPRKFGRVLPGTRLAVRLATDEELSVQWGRIHALDSGSSMSMATNNPSSKWYEPNPDYRLQANKWLVCLADEPESVLHSFWSQVGHWLLEYAVKEALVYVRGRGAVYVGLLMPQLWQDDGDQA